jgi:tRNA 2-thiouridine synthesizing protein E
MMTFGETTYSLDAYGFLEHPTFWDENFAEGIAPKIGVASGLTEDHWRVIWFLRRRIEVEHDVPSFVVACMEMGLSISKFRGLFPTGYMRGACKAAGISFSAISECIPLQTYENLPNIWMQYKLTALGFLESFDAWDERFANLVAKEWDLPCGLTEAHWKVIRFLRQRYTATGSIPPVYETCRTNQLSLQDLHTLFPAGYRRGACRLAGLPLAA